MNRISRRFLSATNDATENWLDFLNKNKGAFAVIASCIGAGITTVGYVISFQLQPIKHEVETVKSEVETVKSEVENLKIIMNDRFGQLERQIEKQGVAFEKYFNALNESVRHIDSKYSLQGERIARIEERISNK